MNSYDVLKNVHKVGHLMTGEVMSYEKYEFNEFGLYACNVELKAETKYKAIVNLVGKSEDFKEELLPRIGSIIETVIKNHVDDTLYLSIDPEDLKLVEEYQAFYQVVETLKEGTITSGVVKSIVPFGLFVNLGYPYPGIVDIGHTDFNGEDRVPIDFAEKIKVGDTIQCIISYFRFYNRQIELGWLENRQ